MSIADCPNYPQCWHTCESQCDADGCGDRPTSTITMPREVVQQAIDALADKRDSVTSLMQANDAIEALRAAMDQPKKPAPRMLSDEKVLEIAHRTASKYAHRSEPEKICYTFFNHTVIDFARKILTAAGALDHIADVSKMVASNGLKLVNSEPVGIMSSITGSFAGLNEPMLPEHYNIFIYADMEAGVKQ